MNRETIDALHDAVTDQDIPILVRMLDDRDRVFQMTAAQTLALMGNVGIKNLHRQLEKMEAPGPNSTTFDYYRRQSIEEALKVQK